MNRIIKILTLTLLVTPIIASAQQLSGIARLIDSVGDLVEKLTVVVAAIALLVFFWGLAKFITKAGSEDAVKEGRRLMIWGIIALFVMITVWGLVNFIRQQLGINQVVSPVLPSVPRP